MNITDINNPICPICRKAALVENEQNEKYCIMCGYKVPPYTESINLDSIHTFTGYAIPRIKYKTEPQIRNDGIYMPIPEYVNEDCEPTYRLIMTPEMFVEAYKKWVAPLLEAEKGEN